VLSDYKLKVPFVAYNFFLITSKQHRISCNPKMDRLQFNRRSSLDHSFDNEDEPHAQLQTGGFGSLCPDSYLGDDDQSLFSRDPFSHKPKHGDQQYEPKMDSCFMGDAMSPSRTSFSGRFGANDFSSQPCQTDFMRGTEYEIFDQVDQNLSPRGPIFDSVM